MAQRLCKGNYEWTRPYTWFTSVQLSQRLRKMYGRSKSSLYGRGRISIHARTGTITVNSAALKSARIQHNTWHTLVFILQKWDVNISSLITRILRLHFFTHKFKEKEAQRVSTLMDTLTSVVFYVVFVSIRNNWILFWMLHMIQIWLKRKTFKVCVLSVLT